MLKKVRKHFKYWQGEFVEDEDYKHRYYGEIRYLGSLRNGFCLVAPKKEVKSAIVTRNHLLHL